MKPTPAKALAAKKKHRDPSAGKLYTRKVFWVCGVRAARQSHRLSLRDVAESVGLSVTTLHQIEHGTDPQLTSARKLAEFFGKTVEELWTKRKEAA